MDHAAENRRKKQISITLMAAAGCVLLSLAGCQSGAMTTQPSKEDQALKAQADQDAINQKNGPLSGTIGSATYVEGTRSMFVQGFGLVIGLPGTGSRECPEQLRMDLMNTIAKYQKLYGLKGQTPSIEAGAIIDSPNTAVVKVSGSIPFGKVKGGHFDLTVEALPNTSTTSLEGGRLLTADLRVYSGSMSGQNNSSRIIATGEGPIFINPFEKKQKRGVLTLNRKGYVLDGGTNKEDRRIHFRLYQPSYGTSRAIEQRINSVFGPPPDDPLSQTAKAEGPDSITIQLPREYRSRLEEFLKLVRNMYILSDPGYIQGVANKLAKEISEPTANAEAISYAWEAMGRSMLPLIQPVYVSSNKQAAFYAIRAGAKLEDPVAIDRLATYVLDPKNPYRKKAIDTLCCCDTAPAKRTLRKLMDDSDLNIRIKAYEGLARMGDISINRMYVGEDLLVIDTVTVKSWPLVYVTRSGPPKIVIFGDLKVVPPVFYSHPDSSVTISANMNDRKIGLVRKSPTGLSSGRVEMTPDLTILLAFLANDAKMMKDGNVAGFGLPYSHLVAILDRLCKNGAVAAKFKMQDLMDIEPDDDLFGRPEKD
jgi:flagellar basal body P-ring protein FlgI